jgi:hypothetical protein
LLRKECDQFEGVVTVATQVVRKADLRPQAVPTDTELRGDEGNNALRNLIGHGYSQHDGSFVS